MFFSGHYFESAYVQLIDLFYKFVVLKFNGDIELIVGLKELKKIFFLPDFSKLKQLKACNLAYEHYFIYFSKTYLDSTTLNDIIENEIMISCRSSQ